MGTDAIKFYLAMLAVAEQKLGTAELTTAKKRLEVAVNTAKEREAEQRKKATAGKSKKPNTAKMGGATDTYDEESAGPFFSGSGSGGGGAPEAAAEAPFARTAYKAEECVRQQCSFSPLPPLLLLLTCALTKQRTHTPALLPPITHFLPPPPSRSFM